VTIFSLNTEGALEPLERSETLCTYHHDWQIRIGEVLGGGMSHVYSARDIVIRPRPVAGKI